MAAAQLRWWAVKKASSGRMELERRVWHDPSPVPGRMRGWNQRYGNPPTGAPTLGVQHHDPGPLAAVGLFAAMLAVQWDNAML